MKTFFTLCLLFTFIIASAQVGELNIDGIVYGSNGLPMKQVKVSVLNASGDHVQEKVTAANGQFAFSLAFGQKWDIVMQKAGHAPKKVVFDTRPVTKEYQAYVYEYGGFRVTLYSGDDKESPQAVGHIIFDPESQTFIQAP
jgi:uncharacterized protein YfaS (alpha-2-macroglobulin family)